MNPMEANMQHPTTRVDIDSARHAPSRDHMHDVVGEFDVSSPPNLGHEVFTVTAEGGKTYAFIAAASGNYWVARDTPDGVDVTHSHWYFRSWASTLGDAAAHWEAQGGDPVFAATIRSSFDDLMEGLAD